MFDRDMLKNVDWIFLGLVYLLLAVNLIILRSASGNVVAGDPNYYLKRQLLWVLLGTVVMVLAALFNYQLLPRWSKYIYIVTLLMLLAVLLVGSEHNGAQRWLNLGLFEFQPAELAKLLIIATFACYLARHKDGMMHLPEFIKACLYVLIPLMLVFLEPDLGTSIVFLAILIGMIWAGGAAPRTLLIVLIIGLVLVLALFGYLFFLTDGYQHIPEETPSWLPLHGYQLTRLIIFTNPYMDPLDSGYHIIQSEVAIGSGGFWGKGFGEGSQVQGNFLPEHHTDFIFAVVGEEFGFVGCIVLMLLYFLLFWRALRIAYNAKDDVGMLLVVGVTSMLFFQVFINVGMTIGIMPVTGLPLPLLSYGGSSMLMNMMAIGLIVGVSLRSPMKIFR